MLPREKLIKDGVTNLSDDELLAIMLGSGSKYEDVFHLAKRLIDDYGFSKLLQMEYKDLAKIQGIKMAKATKLMAVFEITKRCIKNEKNRFSISDSKSLFEYVYPDYMLKKKESLTVIYVDSKLRIIKKEEFSDNDYKEIKIPIKTIVKHSLDYDSYGIFLVHNHPAGSNKPSNADIEYTKMLSLVLKGCQIILLDHIIIADDTYYSFSDNASIDDFLYWFYRLI